MPGDLPTSEKSIGSDQWKAPFILGARKVKILFERVEDPDDDSLTFRRPYRVEGDLCLRKNARSQKVPLATTKEQWQQYKDWSYEGGHLLALKFGGPDACHNLVPMIKGTNSGGGSWQVLEREIEAFLKGNPAAPCIEMDLLYEGDDPREPDKVRCLVTANGMAPQYLPAPDPGKAYTPMRITGPPDCTRLHFTKGSNEYKLFQRIETLAAQKATEGNNYHATSPFKNNVFTDIGPDDPNNPNNVDPTIKDFADTPHPNAMLDVVDLDCSGRAACNAAGCPGAGPNCFVKQIRADIRQYLPMLGDYPEKMRKLNVGSVDARQRLLIFYYVRYKNEGRLLTQDQHLEVEEWKAQIDHIIPQKLGKHSSNEYRNYQMIHHRVNNKRGAGLVGTGGTVKRRRKKTVRYK